MSSSDVGTAFIDLVRRSVPGVVDPRPRRGGVVGDTLRDMTSELAGVGRTGDERPTLSLETSPWGALLRPDRRGAISDWMFPSDLSDLPSVPDCANGDCATRRVPLALEWPWFFCLAIGLRLPLRGPVARS